jgi:segregation and condensation protein A
MHLFSESYKVNLPAFEGPLDLLLHLIRKNDVQVTDIPIAQILEQYVEYLGLLQELNIDLAGEFILMAAELTHIKSKMLLPEASEDEDEGEDPRADLARRLLEYQRFKEAAAALGRRPLLNREVFARPHLAEEEEDEENLEADAFKLLLAFQEILKTLKPEQYHEVAVERLSVTERIYELLEKLKTNPAVTFEALFEGQCTKPQCIVTFLALLEMARLKLIKVFQASLEAPIRIQLAEGEVDAVEVGSEFDEVGKSNTEKTERSQEEST